MTTLRQVVEDRLEYLDGRRSWWMEQARWNKTHRAAKDVRLAVDAAKAHHREFMTIHRAMVQAYGRAA